MICIVLAFLYNYVAIVSFVCLCFLFLLTSVLSRSVISANNDPWKAPLSSSAAVHSMRADPESIIVDPFSPAAQNQLAEFDLLRTEIETKSSNGENNNGLLGKPTNGASNGGTDGCVLCVCCKPTIRVGGNFRFMYGITQNLRWNENHCCSKIPNLICLLQVRRLRTRSA
jgi:hypothetical protein